MKTTIITIILILVILFGAAYFLQQKLDYVTSEEFKEAHQLLNYKIDSIKLQLNNVEQTVERIELNTDTLIFKTNRLEKGQQIIFDEVQIITKRKSNFRELINFLINE